MGLVLIINHITFDNVIQRYKEFMSATCNIYLLLFETSGVQQSKIIIYIIIIIIVLSVLLLYKLL